MSEKQDSRGRKVEIDDNLLQKMLFQTAENTVTNFPKTNESENSYKSLESLVDKIEEILSPLDKLKDAIEDIEKASNPEITRSSLREIADQVSKSSEKIKNLSKNTSKLSKTIKEFDSQIQQQNRGTSAIDASSIPTNLVIDKINLSPEPKFVADSVAKTIVEQLPPPPGGGPPNRPPSGGGGGGDGSGGDMGRSIKEEGNKDLVKFYNSLSSQLASYSGLALGGGTLGQIIFSGAATDATIFRKQMRMIAYEIEGINGSTRGLQAEFADLGDQIVAQTGKEVGETQEAYLRNIKKGAVSQKGSIKDQKQVLKVIKSGLNLSTMIGSESATTADLFADWSRNLGLSASQMSRLAIDAKNVAKTTGVTGDELVSAMKSSEKILENLRNQGNLTSSAMASVIKGSAEAQKLGIGPTFDKVMNSLTSTNKLLNETDDATKAFVFSMANKVGKVDEVLAGTFTQSRSNMKSMSEGMLGMLGDMTHIFGENQIKDWGDLQKLTDQQRMQLAIMLKNTTGMEITEYERLAQLTAEMGKGLGDTLDDLSKKMNQSAATAEERALAQKAYDDAIMNSGSSLMSDISENIIKSGGTLEGYLSTLRQKSENNDATARSALENFNADAEAIAKSMRAAELEKSGADKATIDAALASFSIEGMSDIEKIQMVGVASAERLQKSASAQGLEVEDFSSALKEAISSGDEKSFREITERMQEAQQRLGIKEKTDSEPFSQLGQTLKIANEDLRNTIAEVFGNLIDAIGGLGLTLFAVGTAMASLGFRFPNFATNLETNFKLLPESLQNTMLGIRNQFSSVLSGIGTQAGQFFSPFTKEFLETQKMGGSLFQNLNAGLSPLFMSFGSIGQNFLKIFTGIFGSAGPLVAAASVISGVIFGIMGAFGGFSRTAENFKSFVTDANGNMRELTTGMYISSTAAGGLVGVLDGLTFGILGLIGVTRPLEFLLSNIFNLLAGLVEGLVEGVMYAFTMIQPALRYLGTQFQNIGNAILKVFNSITSIFGAEAGSLGDMFVMLYNVMRSVGYVIGSIIGIPLGAVLWVVVKALSAVMVGFEILANIIAGVVEVVSRFVRAIWSLVTLDFSGFMNNVGGIFTGIYNIIAGIFAPIGSYFYEIFSPLIDFMWGLGSAIISPFRWLYDVLVGHSIIPDLVYEIIKFFAMLPINIMKSLISIPIAIANVFSNIGSYLQSFGNDNIFAAIISQFGNFVQFMGDLVSSFWSVAGGFIKVIQGILTFDASTIKEGLKEIGSNIIKMFSSIGSFLYKTIINTVKGAFDLIKSIPKLLGAALSAIPSLVGKALSGIGNYLMSFGNSNIFGSLLTQFGNISNFIGNMFSNFANGIKSIFKIFEGIVTLDFSKIWEGIKGIGSAILSQLSNVGSFIYNSLANALSGVGDVLYSVFITFPSWLLQSIVSGLSSIGSLLLSGLKSVFVDFPSWLLGTITSGLSSLGSTIVSSIGSALKSVFVDFPTWLYNQFTEALSKVWDYIKSWIPGMKTAESAVSGYKENAAQQAATMAEKGPSTGHALGGLAGAGADVLQLDLGEAASKAGLAIQEGAYATAENIKNGAEAAWSGIKAAGSYLNPLNYFPSYDVGAKKIERSGLAVVHEGEMIVPSSFTDKVSAESSGPFVKTKSVSSGTDQTSKVTNALSSTKKLLFQTDEATKAFVFSIANRIGKTEELLSGSFAESGSNMKSFGEEMLGILGDMTSNFGENKIKEWGDLQKLTDIQQKQLAIMLKNTTGMDLSEFENLANKIEKTSSKNYGPYAAIASGASLFTQKTAKESGFIEQGIEVGGDISALFDEYLIAAGRKILDFGSNVVSNVSKYAAKGFDIGSDIVSNVKTYAAKGFDIGSDIISNTKTYAAKGFDIGGDIISNTKTYAAKGFDIGGDIISNTKTYAAKGFDIGGDIVSNTKTYAAKGFDIGSDIISNAKTYAAKGFDIGSDIISNTKTYAAKGFDIGSDIISNAKTYAEKGFDIGSDIISNTKTYAAKGFDIGGDIVSNTKTYAAKGFDVNKEIISNVKNYASKGLDVGSDIVSSVKQYAKSLDVGGDIISTISSYASKGFNIGSDIVSGMGRYASKGLSMGRNLVSKATGYSGNVGSKAMDLAGKGVGGIGKFGQTITKLPINNIGSKAMEYAAKSVSGISKFGQTIAKSPVGALATKAVGKVAPFLGLITGGISGAMEAEETGRSTAEATILGAITGDAKTGSTLSKYVGIEEGSTADKALGVGGAAATGALTGAAIGSIIPGIGTAIGAGIGGLIGGGAELYKWFTEKKPESSAKSEDLSRKMTVNNSANERHLIEPSQKAFYINPDDKTQTIHDSIDKKLENSSNIIHSVPTVRPLEGEPASGIGSEIDKNVQPVHLRDISQTILREKVGSQPSSGRLQSDELTRMEEASVRQVEELEQIRDGILELVALMKPTGRGAQLSGYSDQLAGSTKDPRRPMHSATFGKMKYGKPGGNANSSIINNGEV